MKITKKELKGYIRILQKELNIEKEKNLRLTKLKNKYWKRLKELGFKNEQERIQDLKKSVKFWKDLSKFWHNKLEEFQEKTKNKNEAIEQKRINDSLKEQLFQLEHYEEGRCVWCGCKRKNVYRPNTLNHFGQDKPWLLCRYHLNKSYTLSKQNEKGVK